jgi:CRP-like cAMP-binding protein
MSKGFLRRRVFYPGEMIFAGGELGMMVYIVEDGMVEIYKNRDGTEMSVAMIGPGRLFGEMSLIDGEPRMAAARVVEQSVIIAIEKKNFMKKLTRPTPS